MVLVWLLVEINVLLFFFSLPVTTEQQSTKPDKPSINQPDGTQKTKSVFQNETTPLLDKQQNPLVSVQSHSIVRVWCLSLSWRIWELIREDTVVLLAILFMTMFNQTAIEVCMSRDWIQL